VLARHRCDLGLSYVELDWETQYDAVRTGEVDVAVVHDVGGADDLVLDRVMDSERFAVVPAESELAAADHLTEPDVADRPRVVPVVQPDLAAWGGGERRRGGVEVRSPANVAAAVAVTGRIGVHAEAATRYFPHPGVRYLPLDGPRAVVAIASRRRDRRDPVAAFRTAVLASGVVEQLAPGSGAARHTVCVATCRRPFAGYGRNPRWPCRSRPDCPLG
jgi:LysR substrate binding domain-containing protein